MSRLAFAVLLALSAAFSIGAGLMVDAAMAGTDEPPASDGGSKAVVVTGEKAGTVVVQAPASGPGVALEIKARPVGKEEASSAPYLVGVYVSGGRVGQSPPKLLGTFSFFPARTGEVQTFVIPYALEGAVLGKDSKVSVKLIPANPARDIKGAAVEILGARVVD